MSKIQPVVTGQKNTIRKEKTYGVLSVQGGNVNHTKLLLKKRLLQIKKMEKTKTKKDADNC